MKATKQNQPEPLESRVLSLIREHKLLAGQQCLLVAVSGGQDSVCLLHILAKLQTELKVNLHVAHLDHQLRGAESESDARYVARLAKKLDIPCTIEKRDVKAYRIRHHLSPEEAAREVRYTFLSEAAQSIGTDRVAVAHTAGDNIETVLMHLIRGSGTRGLRGLQPVSLWQSSNNSLVVVRPMLRISREETAAYCRRHRLMPHLDTSNLNLSPLRNRIRLELLPLLQSYNPRIADALQRTSRLAGETLDFLDKECSGLKDRIVRQQGDIFLFDKAEFLKTPAVLQRHLLRLTIEEILGNLTDIESRHIEQIMAALAMSAGKRLTLPGLTFAIDYDYYWLARDTSALCPLPPLEGETGLKIDRETCLPGWHVTTAVVPVPSEAIRDTDNRFVAYLDSAKTSKELTVRARRAGDWFLPLGMDQPKKLGKFMIDARIPRAWRPRIPIVVSPRQVLWIVGWRIDERVKINEATKKVLRLEFERTGSGDNNQTQI
ncbi:MAG: tRNA lysidine(34) synthetase TilS [Dehalococcoidales bacterium]|nr:tRNA lysidine(34) synthetase TilS [Dehalococcoidales bacterium]